MGDEEDMAVAFIGMLLVAGIFIGTAVFVVWFTGNIFAAAAPIGALITSILCAIHETTRTD